MGRNGKKKGKFHRGFHRRICNVCSFFPNGLLNTRTKQNQQTPKQGSEILETTLDLIDQGETIQFNFCLNNISDKSLSLLFDSGQVRTISLQNLAPQD